MASCCSSSAYEQEFGPGGARKSARAYRSGGLDATARRMVQFLVGRGVNGQTVLEIGGGIGAIQIELLRAGAASATNLEISSGYEAAARELLHEAGLQDRVERRVLDLAREPQAVEEADLVVMHRVVCCYADMEALVTAAAGRARRRLAMTFPADRWYVRLEIEGENLWRRLIRSEFRAYMHSPEAILSTASEYGFRPVMEHRGWIWQTAVLERRTENFK